MKAKLLRLNALAHTSAELTGDAGSDAGGSPAIGIASHDRYCLRDCSVCHKVRINGLPKGSAIAPLTLEVQSTDRLSRVE